MWKACVEAASKCSICARFNERSFFAIGSCELIDGALLNCECRTTAGTDNGELFGSSEATAPEAEGGLVSLRCYKSSDGK